MACQIEGTSIGPGYCEKFYPMIKVQTGDLGMGSNIIRFLRECGDLRWCAIECVLVFVEIDIHANQTSMFLDPHLN